MLIVIVWIFCISDLVWVDPVFVDCHRSCICGLSQILYLWIVTWICWRSRFVGEAEWCLCLPLLRSVRLSRRLSVCHTRPRPNSQVGERGVQKCRQCGQNVQKCQKCPKCGQNRLGHAAVAQWFDWLPDVLALFMGRVEYLTCFKIISEETELTKLLWIGHQTSRELSRGGVRSSWGPAIFDKHRGAQFIGHSSIHCRQADCICYVPNIPLKLWIVWDRDIHLYSQE